MIWNGIKDQLENKQFWVVTDDGWYYSKILGLFFTEAEAIAFWEQTTKLVWNNIDYKSYAQSDHTEGHWYYGLSTFTFQDLFSEQEHRAAQSAIWHERDKIVEQANKELYSKIEREIRQEYKEKLKEIFNL